MSLSNGSMAYNSAAGLGGMLKDGHEHFSDDDGAGAVVARSIAAACELSRMLSSSLGPQGRNKLVVNHLGKMTVTSDCASILKEIEVEHPAAKLLELAVQQQETECGDGTNLALMFAGELLTATVELMKIMGWKHKTDIMEGFHIASTKLLKDLLVSEKDGENGGCVVATLPHPASSPEALQELKEKVLKPVLGSKQYGSEGVLADLIVEACQIVLNDKETSAVLQPSSIRTVKIMGGNVNQSACVKGFVAQRGVETTRKASEKNAKLVVYASGVEASSTEAKGTVLMKTADDLKNYNRTEETKMEETIQAIAESGVKVIVTGGTISDMALHFIEKYELIALKLSSKWELRRLCQATGATALVRLGAPTAEEMGAATTTQKTVGGRTVTVFENDVDGKSKIATLVLRASTSSVLNDLERAVEDGVFAVQQACKDGRIVYGGGACEMECAVKLDQLADQHPGLEQYAIRAFAKSLECVARTLAENAGWDSVQVLSDMRAAHVNGNSDVGVDLESNPGSTSMKTSSASPDGVYDLMHVKRSALKLAIEAATTILKVDQIIMSKRAGGMGR